MNFVELHSWQVSVAQAQETQRRLAGRVSTRDEVSKVRLIAAADISGVASSGTARAAVVVLSYPELEVMESRVIEGKPGFPYVPGLLSFREAPLVVQACQKLALSPDLLLVDGQGLAHPRRMGIACHLGLLLDMPTIGCAKSILCGQHHALPDTAGSWGELVDKGEVVGAALRTREGATPVYVSIGHKVDLKAAIYWVMRSCQGYRLPEPSRLAHQAAAGRLAEGLRQAAAPGSLK